jgi:hypothetical protein
MARKTVRVKVPTNKPEDFLKLLGSVLKKHKQMGAKSPLTSLHMVNMKNFETMLTNAEQLRAKAEELRQQSENLMQQANTTIGVAKGQTAHTPNTLYSALVAVRDYLLVLNKGNEEFLSEWGFNVVVGTAKSPKKKS